MRPGTFIDAAVVKHLSHLAAAAQSAPCVSEAHNLLGFVGRLTPLAIVELCEAWRMAAGVIIQPDVIDADVVAGDGHVRGRRIYEHGGVDMSTNGR